MNLSALLLLTSTFVSANPSTCRDPGNHFEISHMTTGLSSANLELKTQGQPTESYKCGRTLVVLVTKSSTVGNILSVNYESMELLLCRSAVESDKLLSVTLNVTSEVKFESGKFLSSSSQNNFATVQRGDLKGLDGIAGVGFMNKFLCD